MIDTVQPRSSQRYFEPDRQPLNAVDQAMGVVDQALRRLGGAGFETQTLIWLDGRVDTAALKLALARLVRQYPAITGRLMWTAESAEPWWQCGVDDRPVLYEVNVGANDDQAVLEHAAILLAAAPEPAKVAPVRFHLLHRPGGDDVFLMQFSHTVVDHNAAQFLLREINRLTAAAETPGTGVRQIWRDPVWTFLRRHDRKLRLRMARDTIAAWEQLLRKGALQINRAAQRQGVLRLGIATRRLDADATQAVQKSIVKACGFFSPSMSILASGFRALERLAPKQKSTSLVAGIGVDLGMTGASRPTLGNWTSMVPIGVKRNEVHERDALRRQLTQQMRQRLRNGADLGLLQLTSVFSRRGRQALWVIESFMRYGFSLWYAYFGSLDAVGGVFCGAAVRDAFSIGPCWGPMGLTLLVNQFQGRLLLQATYLPDAVPAEAVHQFLDLMVADLV